MGDPIPAPLQAHTPEDVQEMFDTGYFETPFPPFWDGERLMDVEKGTHVLWWDMPTGRRGGPTRVKYFHGTVDGWYDDLHVIVSRDNWDLSMRRSNMVHWMRLVGDPNHEYCIAESGHCYKRAEVWASQMQIVKCSVCDHRFATVPAYEAHYRATHSML